MKKLICAMLSMMTVLSLAACQSPAKPEDTVNGYFEAAKATDEEKMSTFVNPKNLSSRGSSSASSDDEEEIDLANELQDYIKSNNKKVTYTIESTENKDNTATVTVNCKFVDASSILKDSVADYIPKALAKAFTSPDEEDDSGKEITKLMRDKIKTAKETFANKTIKVNCVKIDNKWYIDKENDDLKNIFTSNLVSAGNEMSKSFDEAATGGTSSSSESPKSKLFEINSYIVDSIWNKGFCDIDSYIKTGKNSMGETLDIDFSLQQLDDAMKKKAGYDSYISKLDDSKYAKIKSIWIKLSEETDTIYKAIKAKKPVANSSASFDTGKFQQYMEALSSATDEVK